MRLGTSAAAALLFASPVASAPFSTAPWLADLEQARQAFHAKYANWDWAEVEHGVNIDTLFDQSAARLRNATDQRSAEAVFDSIATKLGDGHVEFDWPEPPQHPNATDVQAKPEFCSGLGYDARQSKPGVIERIKGYVPLPSANNPLPAGILTPSGVKIGVLRIGVFQPQGYPVLCQQAASELAIASDRPCDDACSDRIGNWAYDRLTAALEDRLRQIKAAGARAYSSSTLQEMAADRNGRKRSRASLLPSCSFPNVVASSEASIGQLIGVISVMSFVPTQGRPRMPRKASYSHGRTRPMLRSRKRRRPAPYHPRHASGLLKRAFRRVWSAERLRTLSPGRDGVRMSSALRNIIMTMVYGADR